MKTVLRATPKGFVNTPAVERMTERSLRYLQSGFAIHLRGPAGAGKTTLALHLADLLARPIMLVFGDDELKSSDLIGNQSGYTRKKVVDNFIHSVVKVEDELRHNWIDSRLTLAAKEGFTLVYDEFNRSRPEVNNVLLSALEEKLIVLPPGSGAQNEYVRVHPQFRVIFTSNPEEYCAVHSTQDALMDRLVTLSVPEPDSLTQSEILVQKIGLERAGAQAIVQIVKTFRQRIGSEKSSGLRSCMMIAKVCHEHDIAINAGVDAFRDVCEDVLLSRAGLPLNESTQILWEVLETIAQVPQVIELQQLTPPSIPEAQEVRSTASQTVPFEEDVKIFLQRSHGAKVSEIEAVLKINRVQSTDALRALIKKGAVKQRDDRSFVIQGELSL